MGILKLFIIAGALGFAAHLWNGSKERIASASASASTEQISDSGFIRTVMVSGANPDTVLILAPPNCPSEEARRAADLSERLNRMGIPNVMGSSFSVSIQNPSAEERAGIDRAIAVFQSGAPAVFINSMAKSNPSAEEVASEYKRVKAGY